MSVQAKGETGRQFFRESFLYLIANVGSRAASFLMIPVYSRCLSPAEYGSIELIELATQVVSLLIGLNLFGNALNRVFQDQATEEGQSAVTSTAILGSMAANLAGTVLAVLASGFISAAVFKATAQAELLRATFLSMFFGNVVDVCLSYVRLKRRAGYFVSYSLITLVATLGLNILFIAVQGRGVWGFVLSKLLVTGAGGAFLLFRTLRETRIHWHYPSASRMFRFGAPLILANLSFFVLHFGDRLFLSRFSTLTEVGNYALAYKFGFLVTFIVGEPFGRAWGVRYASMLNTDGWPEQFRSISRYLAFSLMLASLVIILFADEVMRLMVTPPYFPAFRAIPFIVFAYCLRELGDFFRNILFIRMRSMHVGLWSAVAAVVNCGLNFLLVPRYAMIGAAVSTLITWAGYAAAMYLSAEREMRIGFPFRSYAAFAGIAFCLFLVSIPVAALPLPAQFVADTLLALAFVGIAWKVPVFSVPERTFIRSLLAPVAQRIAALAPQGWLK
jgi:O-antigen/teichoic acid export membrane protein